MHEKINQRPAVPLPTNNLFHHSPYRPPPIPTCALRAGRRGPLLGVWEGVLSGKPGLVLGRCVTFINGVMTPIEFYHF